jgi:hypothetical protein
MWRIGDDKAYPFRHKHSNHFPPPPRYSQQRPLSPCFEEDQDQPTFIPLRDVEEEVPIVFQSPIINMAHEAWKFYPLTPPLLTPPPFDFPSAPTLSPSATAPENITGLLQDVLGIMNGIMDEQSAVQMEAESLDGFLHDLTQLVVLIQDEAMLMTEHAELVEEYVEEVQVAEQVEELEEWVFNLNLENVGPRAQEEVKQVVGGQLKHEREDSGVELGEVESSGELSEVKEGRARRKIEEVQPRVPEKSYKRFVTTLAGKPSLRRVKQKKAPPQFRDSGLGLSPHSSPLAKTARWI